MRAVYLVCRAVVCAACDWHAPSVMRVPFECLVWLACTVCAVCVPHMTGLGAIRAVRMSLMTHVCRVGRACAASERCVPCVYSVCRVCHAYATYGRRYFVRVVRLSLMTGVCRMSRVCRVWYTCATYGRRLSSLYRVYCAFYAYDWNMLCVPCVPSVIRFWLASTVYTLCTVRPPLMTGMCRVYHLWCRACATCDRRVPSFSPANTAGLPRTAQSP